MFLMEQVFVVSYGAVDAPINVKDASLRNLGSSAMDFLLTKRRKIKSSMT